MFILPPLGSRDDIMLTEANGMLIGHYIMNALYFEMKHVTSNLFSGLDVKQVICSVVWVFYSNSGRTVE